LPDIARKIICDTMARRANHLARAKTIGAKMSSVDRHCARERSRLLCVIPGRLEEASPESIGPQECWEKWIPDSRLRGFRNDGAPWGERRTKAILVSRMRRVSNRFAKPGPTSFLQ